MWPAESIAGTAAFGLITMKVLFRNYPKFPSSDIGTHPVAAVKGFRIKTTESKHFTVQFQLFYPCNVVRPEHERSKKLSENNTYMRCRALEGLCRTMGNNKLLRFILNCCLKMRLSHCVYFLNLSCLEQLVTLSVILDVCQFKAFWSKKLLISQKWEKKSFDAIHIPNYTFVKFLVQKLGFGCKPPTNIKSITYVIYGWSPTLCDPHEFIISVLHAHNLWINKTNNEKVHKYMLCIKP